MVCLLNKRGYIYLYLAPLFTIHHVYYGDVRLRWRENIEILDTLSWYQPIKNKNEYTHHFDEKNNVSLYLNLYQSRYLHLNLKAFDGKLYLEDEIKIFIDEDRRIKRSEISYFDHPKMGIIVRINKT